VILRASAAQALSLALHELATNALKYGALAQPDGRLWIAWQQNQRGDKPVLELEWHESGVKMTAGPSQSRKGYGRELIERALPYQLRADSRLEFLPEGVRCRITVPLREAAH
jgi:two-component sensor histidine kinase